jgi:hypothetical protein
MEVFDSGVAATFEHMHSNDFPSLRIIDRFLWLKQLLDEDITLQMMFKIIVNQVEVSFEIVE